jgi:hypothetical protein
MGRQGKLDHNICGVSFNCGGALALFGGGLDF